MILDEVTAALDFADRESVFQTMEAFSRAGGLILFISHRMDEVVPWPTASPSCATAAWWTRLNARHDRLSRCSA